MKGPNTEKDNQFKKSNATDNILSKIPYIPSLARERVGGGYLKIKVARKAHTFSLISFNYMLICLEFLLTTTCTYIYRDIELQLMKRMHDLTIGPESLHDAVFYKGQQFVIVWLFHLASSTNKVRYLNFTGPNLPHRQAFPDISWIYL